ncbi:MAG: hypothetical protein HDT39_09025 [Lachnospiraceae bacterium]|nr:hypothetical protein [Lachnospiraceae bacterium]
MLGISRKVFSEFECSDIKYCHWKSNEHLEEGLNGTTDLDILVDHNNKKECENILHRLKLLKVRAPLGNKYKYVDDWIGMDYDTGEMIHLHLHYRIVTGKQYRKEWVLPWSKMVLENRVKNEELNVYMTNPNMEIIILYVRVLLKTKYNEEQNDIIEVPNDYLREIRYLKKVTDEKQIDIFLKKMLKSSDFKRCLFKESFTNKEYLYYKEVLKSVLGKYRIESEKQTFIKHKMLKSLVYIEQNLKKKSIPMITKKCPNDKGLIIAFIGTDGAGKSTMTKNIQSWLSWKIEVFQFYLGSGDGLKKPLTYKIYTNENMPKALKQWAGAGFYFYMSLYVKGKTRQIDGYRKRGGIAVLDRFPQLQYKGVNDGPKIEKNIEKAYFPDFLIKRIIKKEEENIRKAIQVTPDIVFKLKISPEEAIRRKKENTLAEMKRKVAFIEGIEFEGSKVYNIDASQNMNQEMLEVKRIIWDEIYQRQLL